MTYDRDELYRTLAKLRSLELEVAKLKGPVEHEWDFCCYFDVDMNGDGRAHEHCRRCGSEAWGDSEFFGECTGEWEV